MSVVGPDVLGFPFTNLLDDLASAVGGRREGATEYIVVAEGPLVGDEGGAGFVVGGNLGLDFGAAAVRDGVGYHDRAGFWVSYDTVTLDGIGTQIQGRDITDV